MLVPSSPSDEDTATKGSYRGGSDGQICSADGGYRQNRVAVCLRACGLCLDSNVLSDRK